MHEMCFWCTDPHDSFSFSGLSPPPPGTHLNSLWGAHLVSGLPELVAFQSSLGEGLESMCLTLGPGFGWV